MKTIAHETRVERESEGPEILREKTKTKRAKECGWHSALIEPRRKKSRLPEDSRSPGPSIVVGLVCLIAVDEADHSKEPTRFELGSERRADNDYSTACAALCPSVCC